MTTVVDALVLELGIDPSKFNYGKRDVDKALKDILQDLTKGGKAVEKQTKDLGDIISTLTTRALGLFAILAGGRDLKQFAQHIVDTNAEVSRMAHRTGLAEEAISKWRRMARLAGVDSDAVAGQIEGMSLAFANFHQGIVGNIPELNQLGVAGDHLIDINRGVEKTLIDASIALENIRKKWGADVAYTKAEAAGLGGSLYELLQRGPAAIREYTQAVERSGTTTKGATEAAQQLLEIWGEIRNQVDAFGDRVLGIAGSTGVLTNLLKSIRGSGGYFEKRDQEIHDQLGWLSKTIFGTKYGMFGTSGSSNEEASGITASRLRLKRGATGGGDASVGLLALAASLQGSIPGLKEFTALNDQFHSGTGSKHAQGLALDFTLKDPGNSASISTQLRQKLQGMGISAQVLDEYLHPSAGSTGGHVHVGFANASAAQRYADYVGGGASAAVSSVNKSSTMSVNNQIDVAHVAINTQATDAKGIAADLGSALQSYARRTNLAAQAQGGQR